MTKLHQLTCKLCETDFYHKRITKQFCSNECVQKNKSIFQKAYKNSEEGRIKNSESQKIAQNRPDVKARRSELSKERANRPEVKEKFSKWSKEFHNREEVKIATSEWTKKYFKENPEAPSNLGKISKDYFKNVYPNDKEAQTRRSEKSKETSARPEVKEKRRDSLKEYWSDEEKRKEHSIKQKIAHTKPNMIETHRKNSQKLWEDSQYADKVLKGMTYKTFTFPSGRIVKTQGYENIVLNDLIKEYNESDIFVGPSEIKNQIGRIEYTFDNKQRSYYPDIYIKSINMIIEVKSEYTFSLNKEINLAKEKACLDMGLNFKFDIR
jgi:hypothetical protein